MTCPIPCARTRAASGRFLRVALGILALSTGACQTVGGTAGDGPEVGPPAVVVAPGTISDADERAARELLDSARASFEANRHFEVVRITEEIVSGYPASGVSGEALHLNALAHFEVGQIDEAVAAAERYVGLAPPDDPISAELLLLQARVLRDVPAESVERLLRIGGIDDPVARAEAVDLARTASDSLDVETLEGLVAQARPDGALRPVVEARLAVSLLDDGMEADARLFARRALEAGVSGTEAAWAEAVLRGELPPERARVTTFQIGAVLPMTGPPALAEYAEGIREGIEVAVETVLGDEFTVSTVVRDDQGDPLAGAELVRELEESDSVAAIVGFLLDDVLVSAGQARLGGIPLVSPTARTATQAGEGVYSLEGAHPEAAEAVAEYAASRAFQRIAMLHPASPAAEAEADAFEARAEELGMRVVGRFEYEPGATFFEPQILGARDALRAEELASLSLAQDDTLHMEMLEPAALFMPVPPEDVEFLAPQVVHFGLDTLAIEVLGTSGWTDPQILPNIDTRLTDGVVATEPAGTDPSDEGPARFRRAYEEIFRRSLVSTAPAVGYDATLILLEALRRGRVEPDRLRSEMEELQEIHGATGIFSIEDGRIVRRTDVVRIEGGVTVRLMVDDPMDRR